jgi:hypothetical protein
MTLASVLRVPEETAAQRVGGRWAAATADGGFHQFEDEGGVSEVGERIMDLVDGQRSLGEIVSMLCEEFDVERVTCERETIRFVAELVQKRVLEAVR